MHLPERFRSDLPFVASLLIDQPLASPSLLFNRPYLVIGSCLFVPSLWVIDTYPAAFIVEPYQFASSFLAVHKHSWAILKIIAAKLVEFQDKAQQVRDF